MTESSWAAESNISTTHPPPPAGPEGSDADVPVPRPGQTTFGWRVALFMLWLLAIASMSSVWQVAARIGHTTWWLGPPGEPNPALAQLAPFIGPSVMLVLILRNNRWLAAVGIIVALGLIGLGIVDLGFYERLGIIEIVTGSLCLIGTLAALVGRVPNRANEPAAQAAGALPKPPVD